ncbi:MAG: molybdopterin-dependent oxidoreductase, partial [Burkholderiaceae bacterium]|nr:molybdopterin-dependent oxidoreductase [Burkholderiaceae bacterium]
LWIACTNPAQSIPDQALVRRALQRCEFVVVQEAFATAATCDFADLLLPAASWGEKEGTVTNSERRISRVRAAVPAAGEARQDWSIATDFARRLAARLDRAVPRFDYATPEAVWNEHRESTRGRDLDITGLSWAMLDAQGPQQWPLPEGAPAGRARLYEDGVFPTTDGRARFVAAPYKPVVEPRDARYPFALTTGRLRDQWHGMTRTGTLGRLFAHVPEPVVQLHPQDMARRLLAEGALVHVTSRRGTIVLPVQGSDTVAPGQAFVAMHWGSEFLGGRTIAGDLVAGVNALTQPAYCPDSKQPELKHAAVKILKAELPWGVFGMAWLPEAEVQARRQQLRALMGEFAFATCVPFSDNRPLADGTPARHGLLFRAAAADAVAPAVLRALEVALGLQTDDTLRYADTRRHQHRAARMVRGDDGAVTLGAVLLAGDTQAEGWIRAVLHEGQPAQTYGRLLLAPVSKAPIALPVRGKAVCSCFGVSQSEIEGHLASCDGSDAQRLASLQGALKCGTNCGSCVPELKRLVRQVSPLREAA